MRVLYVEDNLCDADVTVRMLGKSAPNIQVEIATTVETAVARLSNLDTAPLDLVLTDMHLKDGDGLSLLNHIRENNVPVAVVVVTGMGDEETAVEALKSHADDYVVKHKDYLDRLPLTLESALNHYRIDSARRTHSVTVLFVEHDPATAEAIRKQLLLNAKHIQLNVVFSAAEALYLIKSSDKTKPPDVLLLDLDMPRLKALESLRELTIALKPDIPVVAVCSPENEELALQCLQRGVASYVVKRPGYLYQLPWELEDAHARAELARREAALHQSEERTRAILSAIPDLMFLQTREGIFLDFHARDPALLLVPPEQFLGKRLDEVFPPHLATEFAERFARVFVSNGPAVLEYSLTTPQGVRTFEASMVSCNGDKVLSIVRDISERKEAEEALRNALAEVQLLKDRLHEENVYLQQEVRVLSDFGEIIGESKALKRVLRQAEQVAAVDTTVLLLGETGTGKELFAHAIHNLSARHTRPLVKVNCAALPAPLIESELFGHMKGAFTGADSKRLGRFEIANGGTIFLDEVGELPMELQAKLLRILEEGQFEPLGSSRTVRADARVIAATNRDLAEAVRKGTFRSDLFYRLSIFPITVPPLRERREDIPILVAQLTQTLSRKLNKTIDKIPYDVMTALKNYYWPGNVRELRNVIERAVIISGSTLRLTDTLESQSLKPELRSGFHGEEATETETLSESESRLILSTLKKVNWRIEGRDGAAALLEINPSTLRTRMKKLGISRPRIKNVMG
jgi:PAS domain S-box-containing protein